MNLSCKHNCWNEVLRFVPNVLLNLIKPINISFIDLLLPIGVMFFGIQL